MRAYVHGFYGALNVGDEAICKAIVEGLRHFGRYLDITVGTRELAVSRSFTHTDARLMQGFYPTVNYWWRFPHHVYRIARSNILIIGGGGLFQDVHGWTMICRYMLSACLGILLDCPVVILGAGAGPVNRPWVRRLTGTVCSMMNAIYVRNPVNRRIFIECGVRPELVEVRTDLVPSLPLEQWVESRRRPSNPPRRIAFALRKWPGLNEEGVVKLWEALARQGCTIDLLCYEDEQDKIFYESLLAQCTESCRRQVTVRIPKTLQEAVADVTAADFMVSMRLHGCIFAAYLGIPLLAMPYHTKVRVFMEEAGMAGQLRPLAKVGQDWVEDIRQIVSRYTEMPNGLSDALLHLRAKSVQSFGDAMAVARRDGAPKKSAPFEAKVKALSIAIVLVFVGIAKESLHVLDYVRRKVIHLPRRA
jgi:polysaccharide pyruvyl transferase CsaB